ncbi:hypothetical protein ACIRJR_05870 [Streptomyces sp. NPDC102402]|uniref:hypothetical protein n=1 Tax=Streptomyces sp. NPDC102402 TaxID=3366169 RepID=UPI0037FF6ADA
MRKPVSSEGTGSDGTVGMLVCAAQTGALLAGVVVVESGRTDAYGRPPGSALGLVCVLVFAPPLLLLFGAVHTFVMTMPADLLARAALRRADGALWQWQCGSVVALGAVYAAGLAAVGAPFLCSWAWISGSGALPLLAVAWFHRGERRRGRPYSKGDVWFRVLPAGFLLTAAVMAACGAALGTGAVGAYEAPSPTGEAMRGVWVGEDGRAEVRLQADGRAVLSAVPYGDWEEEGRCDGTGTWSYVPEDGAVRGTVGFDLAGEGCPVGPWTVGGTDERLELYDLFGDPDGGAVRVLVRQGPG